MSKRVLIGLCGAAQSGKSTLAKHLLSAHEFERVAFADPLKDMLRAVGVPKENLYGDKKEQPLDLLCGRSARYAMQRLGCEFGRNILGEDFWVRIWRERAKRHARVVADDVRFPQEQHAVRSRGGIIVKVVRPGMKIELSEHASENSLDDRLIDHIIVNDAGIEQLTVQMDRVIEDEFGLVNQQLVMFGG